MRKTILFVSMLLIFGACNKPSDEEQLKTLADNIIESLKTNDNSNFESYFASYEETQAWISSWSDKTKANRDLKHLNNQLADGKYDANNYKDMFYKLRQDPIMLYHDTAFWSIAKLESIDKTKISITDNNASKTQIVAKFTYKTDEIKLLIEPFKEGINNRWYIAYSPIWLDYEKKMMERIFSR